MGTTAEKLTYLNRTKTKLYSALEKLGAITFDSSTPFRNVAERLSMEYPDLYSDFSSDTYRLGNTSKTFEQMYTHSRTSNATMTDSDGYIKWAPHNLLSYSEDFSNWNNAWSGGVTLTSNASTAPDGTTTADRIAQDDGASDGIFMSFTPTSSTSHRVNVFLKAGTAGRSAVFIYKVTGGTYPAILNITWTSGVPSTFGATGATDITYTSVGHGWYLVGYTFTSDSGGHRLVIQPSTESLNTDYIYVWGAHLYRSDLGGMVNNPDRGDSYVPTALRPYGPELVTNGTFDTDSDWTKGTGWSISGGVATHAAGTGSNLDQNISVVNGTAYEISFTVSGLTAGYLQIYLQGSGAGNVSSNITSDGDYTIGLIAGSASSYQLRFFVSSTFDGSLDNVSVRQSSVNPSAARYMPRVGHHVYNGYEWVNEGVLAESEARTNSILYSNDLSQTQWTKQQTTVTGNAGISPDGTNNAWKLSETAVTATHLLAVAATASACCSIYAKAGTRSRFRINSGSSGNAFAEFNLSDGTIYNGAGGTYYTDSTMEDVGNGWYRCSLCFSGSLSTTFTIAMEDDDGFVNYAGDTSKHIFLYGGQVETGKATPSSYIPTSGSTVTRAAETFTIPSANLPWPEPEYIGSELVTNGTFDTDSDWTKGAGWSISGGVASCNGTQAFATNFNAAGGGGLLTVGKPYLVTFDITSYTSGSIYQRVGSGGNGTSRSSVGTFSEVGVAQTNGEFLFTASSDFIGSIDNVSVREINPLSVSIQMDGRMTYADEGVLPQHEYLRWYADSSNYFRWMFDTQTGTGGPLFRQASGGVFDSVEQYSAYSPDILIPYSFASRHGSTFLNGAVDGVALTADTTPVALPDLSSTDLSLGYDYMGTIKHFRIWAEDIGDDGIVHASTDIPEVVGLPEIGVY